MMAAATLSRDGQANVGAQRAEQFANFPWRRDGGVMGSDDGGSVPGKSCVGSRVARRVATAY